MTFDFHEEALREYEAAGLYYEEQRYRLGVEFTQAVETAISDILAHPERYQLVGGGIRVFRVKRFPYLLYYWLDERREHVRFVAVMHQRRRPDYWRTRIRGPGGGE